MTDVLIGIDLGTSTSEVAYLKDEKPFIIPNRKGNRITPSVIGIDDFGDWIVGEEAKEQLLQYLLILPMNKERLQLKQVNLLA